MTILELIQNAIENELIKIAGPDIVQRYSLTVEQEDVEVDDWNEETIKVFLWNHLVGYWTYVYPDETTEDLAKQIFNGIKENQEQYDSTNK